MRRALVTALMVVGGGGLLNACAAGSPSVGDAAPWKTGADVQEVTAAPDAGGPLSWRNCPTLSEARAAVPFVRSGPDANAVPFKNMILQCAYGLGELDSSGRQASIGILVFDASAEGPRLWDAARTDPSFPDPRDVVGLAEVAFSTGTTGHYDLWVANGRFGFHMTHLRQGPIALDQMVALARAMLAGLTRAPR